MQVLQTQRIPNGQWNCKWQCDNCLAILRIEENDLIRIVGQCGYVFDEAWDFCSTKCPECQKNINIQSEDIPRMVKERIPNGNGSCECPQCTGEVVCNVRTFR